ncbi:MAG: potassium channel family protein [Sphingomonadales bacterium]|nr:potassium channel family protein [Sphingomonadales bacterium]
MAAAAKTDHALERLVFFSDAVFAIAITLLIIDIHAPHLSADSPDRAYWIALANLWPNLIGYFISFAVIGLFWMGHHRAFALAARYHPRVLGWNLALLCTIGFMPFVTAYVATNMFAKIPSIFYCATLLVAALLNMRVGRIVTGPDMVGASADPEAVGYVRARGLSVVLGSATAIAICFVVPHIAQGGLISIPIWRRLLTRKAKAA